MSRSETPIGENGINEKEIKIKYVSEEEVVKKINERWNDFFEGEELGINAFYFDYPETEKILGGDDEKEKNGLISDMNIISPAKYKANIKDIIDGVNKKVFSADMDKIKKAKTRAVEKRLALRKKEEKKKNPVGGNEKPDKTER